MCLHTNFSALVRVACFEEGKGWSADVTIHCTDCHTPMQFLGLPAGVDLQGATVSVDGLEARLAIAPQGTVPSLLDTIKAAVKPQGH